MKKLGIALTALGAFLLVAALMIKVYAYPKIAVAPKDQNSLTTLLGPDATVFDISSLSEITTDLTSSYITVGDVKAAEKEGNNVVVWLTKASTKSSDGVVRSRSIDRVAFDATSGEAVNCCGEFYETTADDPQSIQHKGLLVKFPFNTQKKTYDFWDSNILQAVPIKYVSTEDVEGVTTYKFTHTIEPTQTGTIELPADLLGEDGDESLEGQRMYSNIRTLWVEPETGVIIKREEQQDNTIDYDGTPRITTTKVTTAYDDATVKDNADTYGPLATQLKLLRTTLPLVFLILGLLMLIGGFVLMRRDEAPEGYDDEE